MRWRAIALTVAAAALVLFYVLRHTDSAGAPSSVAAVEPRPAPALAPPARLASPAASPAAARPLPLSLAGTEVVGGLAVDASGHLILDDNVRRFFDYFLTALGEESLDDIRQRIESEIARRLPPDAAAQAREVLRRYLAFRAAAARLDATTGDLAARVAAIRAVRRAEMGDEAATKLFASQDALTDVELERRAVMAENLGDDERARRLAAAEARLPDSLRVVREAALAPVVAMQHEEALRQSGASAADITAYRTATFGPEAAQRLAALDEQRARWQARLDGFRAERARLEATISDEATRNRELMRLFASEFSEAERLRVAALERIAEHPLPAAP
jgi:lipase chaperone LimK